MIEYFQGTFYRNASDTALEFILILVLNGTLFNNPVLFLTPICLIQSVRFQPIKGNKSSKLSAILFRMVLVTTFLVNRRAILKY